MWSRRTSLAFSSFGCNALLQSSGAGALGGMTSINSDSQFRFNADRGGAGRPQQHQQPRRRKPAELMPTKDRLPPRDYNPKDPRRRLAVLVDAEKITDPQTFIKVDPHIEDVGTPIMYRFFAQELLPQWKEFLLDNPTFEWFRVEKFIPVHIQIGADARHIADFRMNNKIQGLVFVVDESERLHYEQYFKRAKGVNQYIFDQTGLAAYKDVDKRPGDGTPN